jgi:uncharacterized SAM-binding protein YcdF (DUF218 family)
MFFLLSKLFAFLASPVTWGALPLAGGLVALYRGRRFRGAALALSGVLVLWLFSAGPVANGLMRSLEERAPATLRAGETYDLVIVLGGLLDPVVSADHGAFAFNENVERLLGAFELLRERRARYALLSSGSAAIGGGPPEADALAAQLAVWGVEKERLLVEDRSRNTHENALESAAIVAAHDFRRVLLVTSAFHVPRALRCFRKVGLDVDVMPVDWRTYDPRRHSGNWLPGLSALEQSADAIHELVGLLVYRIVGYT